MNQNGFTHNLMNRRRFLQLSSGMLLALGGTSRLSAATADGYRVGVGHASDPYAATIRAVSTSNDWDPALISGKRVVIKPNLVAGLTAESGTTTDPEVVRALVDMALAAGAVEVWIIEAGPNGAFFTECGYDFFDTYDQFGRVSLVDLAQQPVTLVPVPSALAYSALYMPALLFEENTFLITVAKMKVHTLAQVTLAMKNQFGMPPPDIYARPGQPGGRYSMHDRSVSQSIIDLNHVRPVDFAVVDGIWAMNETGPWGGLPLRIDLVFAGRNTLAVDLVCITAMGISPLNVQHILYGMQLGMGPKSLADIELRGDPFTPVQFTTPPQGPMVGYPISTPRWFRPSAGAQTMLSYTVDMPCQVHVEIATVYVDSPEIDQVRLIQSWSHRGPGRHFLVWGGRDNNGQLVTPKGYALHVSAKAYDSSPLMNGTGMVGVY